MIVTNRKRSHSQIVPYRASQDDRSRSETETLEQLLQEYASCKSYPIQINSVSSYNSVVKPNTRVYLGHDNNRRDGTHRAYDLARDEGLHRAKLHSRLYKFGGLTFPLDEPPNLQNSHQSGALFVTRSSSHLQFRLRMHWISGDHPHRT